MAKYSRDLCAYKKKSITTVKRAMTRGNVFPCTTIFSQNCSFLQKFVITYYSNFFLRYVTLSENLVSKNSLCENS